MATQREVILDVLASVKGPADAKLIHAATQERGHTWTITQILASCQVMAAQKLVGRGPQPKTFIHPSQALEVFGQQADLGTVVEMVKEQVQAETHEALTQIAEKSGKKSRPAKTAQNRVKLERAPEASGSGKLSVNEIRRFLQEARCEEKPADPKEHSLLLTDKQISDKANLLAALLDARNFFDVKDVSFRVVKGANALSGADTQLIYLQPVWTRKNK